MHEAPTLSQPVWLEPRLSLMFFVDLGVIAAYSPLLSLHLAKTLALSPAQIAMVYAVGPLATLVGPAIAGWVADRLVPAERSLACLNFLRVGALLLAANAKTFPEVVLAMAIVGLLTAPSVVLCYAIAFHHLRDTRGLGRTRVWGAVSWIVVVWLTSAHLQRFGGIEEQLAETRHVFHFAALLALLAAVNALTLPHTPPARSPAHPFAFLAALGLLRDRSFRGLVFASMLTSVCLQFHFMLWPLFFTDAKSGLGMDVATAARASSLAQLPELLLFPALGALVARFGLRRVLIAGTLAWPLRFVAYSAGEPLELVVGMQLLHGVTVVCGAVAAQIAVDRVAPLGARASSHALLAAATGGAGNLVGQLACGAALGSFARPDGSYDWPWIFALPLASGLIATSVVALRFRPAPA